MQLPCSMFGRKVTLGRAAERCTWVGCASVAPCCCTMPARSSSSRCRNAAKSRDVGGSVCTSTNRLHRWLSRLCKGHGYLSCMDTQSVTLHTIMHVPCEKEHGAL